MHAHTHMHMYTHRGIPELVMKSRIEHPCVKDGQIKLDTLTDCTVEPTGAEKRYYYYTPGYTVYGILVQLHGVCGCVCGVWVWSLCVQMFVCVCMIMCVCVCVCVRVCVCVCVWVWVCVYACV